MNTVNGSLVTTGKVNLLKAQRPPSQAEKRKRIRNLIGIFFISVILFALITGSTLVALIRKYNIGFQHRQVQETAQAFCSMTEHVPACHRSISTHFTTASRHKWEGRPDDIFVLSLQLATEQLSNLTSLTKSLISKSSNNYHHSRSDTSPLQQCTSLIHDSLDRLNSSLTTSAGVLRCCQQSHPSRASNFIAISDSNTEEKSEPHQILFLLRYLPSADHRCSTLILDSRKSSQLSIPIQFKGKPSSSRNFLFLNLAPT